MYMKKKYDIYLFYWLNINKILRVFIVTNNWLNVAILLYFSLYLCLLSMVRYGFLLFISWIIFGGFYIYLAVFIWKKQCFSILLKVFSLLCLCVDNMYSITACGPIISSWRYESNVRYWLFKGMWYKTEKKLNYLF